MGTSGYMEFCQPHWDEFTVTHLSRPRNLGFPIVIDKAEMTGHENVSSFMGRLVTAPLDLDSELLMVLSGPDYRSTSAYWALFRTSFTDIGKQQWAGQQARLCGRLQLGAGWQPLQGLEATL